MTEVENRKIAHGRFSLYREHKLRFSTGKRRAPNGALGIRVWEPERFQGPTGQLPREARRNVRGPWEGKKESCPISFLTGKIWVPPISL